MVWIFLKNLTIPNMAFPGSPTRGWKRMKKQGLLSAISPKGSKMRLRSVNEWPFAPDLMEPMD